MASRADETLRAGVRPARPEEAETLALVMARAFEADPFYRWLFPDPADRARGCERTFRGLVHRLVPFGVVLTTPSLDGAIAWYPKGFRPRLGVRLAHVRDQVAVARILGRRALLIRRGVAELEQFRLKEPHAYFAGVGIAPGAQRGGLGSALIAAFFEHCDRAGDPVCGVASSEAHVAMYRAHGAELVGGSLTLPEGPTVWPMVRHPRRAREAGESAGSRDPLPGPGGT